MQGFCVVRINADGALDTSLNASGFIFTQISGANNEATSVVLQPDGKILAAGVCRGSNNSFDFCVVRYDGGPFSYRDCPLDIDGDGKVLATTDALIMTRIALGMRGSSVLQGINLGNAPRNDWDKIRTHLVSQCGMSLAP